jgi:hypothetical protein
MIGTALIYMGWAVAGLVFLYIAARLITAGVLWSWREYQNQGQFPTNNQNKGGRTDGQNNGKTQDQP